MQCTVVNAINAAHKINKWVFLHTLANLQVCTANVIEQNVYTMLNTIRYRPLSHDLIKNIQFSQLTDMGPIPNADLF